MKKEITVSIDSDVFDSLSRTEKQYSRSISDTVNMALRFHYFDELPEYDSLVSVNNKLFVPND